MSTTQIELERKFLIAKMPENLSQYKKQEIAQAYIAIDDTLGTATRIRSKDGVYILNTKSPNPDGKGVIETEEFVDKSAYDQALENNVGFVVTKTRHLIPYGDLTIELDVFHNKLEGLVFAEIEFPNETIADEFTPPDWLGKEVTDDKNYANKNLCRNGMPA